MGTVCGGSEMSKDQLYICNKAEECKFNWIGCIHSEPHIRVSIGDIDDDNWQICSKWGECEEMDNKVRCIKVKDKK